MSQASPAMKRQRLFHPEESDTSADASKAASSKVTSGRKTRPTSAKRDRRPTTPADPQTTRSSKPSSTKVSHTDSRRKSRRDSQSTESNASAEALKAASSKANSGEKKRPASRGKTRQSSHSEEPGSGRPSKSSSTKVIHTTPSREDQGSSYPAEVEPFRVDAAASEEPKKRIGRPRNPNIPRDENGKGIYYIKKGYPRSRKARSQREKSASKTPQSSTPLTVGSSSFGGGDKGAHEAVSGDDGSTSDSQDQPGSDEQPDSDEQPAADEQFVPRAQSDSDNGYMPRSESETEPESRLELSVRNNRRNEAVHTNYLESPDDDRPDDSMLSLPPQERETHPVGASPQQRMEPIATGGLRDMFKEQPCEEDYSDIENALPKDVEWTKLDELILQSTVSSHPSELSLWQIVWQVFEARLTELFRFGLWPEHGGVVLADGTKFRHPYMKQSLVSDLRRLACHPAWEDNLDVFRHVLMCAVQYRVLGHDEPLEPIQSQDRTIERAGLSMAEKALFAYKQTKKHGIGSKHPVKLICGRLRELITPWEPDSGVETALFILRTEDTQNVIDALNSVQNATTGLRPWLDVGLCYNVWMKVVSKQRDGEVWPRDNEHLASLKKQHVLKCRLAAQCRVILQHQDMERFLYNVSQTNRRATAICFENVLRGPTESQLRVVRGLTEPPFGPQMSATGWKFKERNQAPRYGPESSPCHDRVLLRLARSAPNTSPTHESTPRQAQQSNDRSTHPQSSIDQNDAALIRTPRRADLMTEQPATQLGSSGPDDQARPNDEPIAMGQDMPGNPSNEMSGQVTFAIGKTSGALKLKSPFQTMSTPLLHTIPPLGAAPYNEEETSQLFFE